MNLSKIFQLALASVLCLAFTRFAYHPLLSHPIPVRGAEQESPTGKDDPDARSRFEWMQLRDPATGRIPNNIRSRELAFAKTLRINTTMAPAGSTPTITDINWQQRGPSNVGGRTRALALDVNSDAIMIAGGVTGGMWRSVDSGKSWKRTSTLDELPSVTCVTQDVRAGKTNVWYYGTGEYRTNVQRFGNALYYGNGIYKSIDSGKSWVHLTSTAGATNDQAIQPFNYVWKIVVDPSVTQNDIVYAAVYGGIMRSSDGGTSWASVLGGNGNASGYTTVEITSTGVLYAALSTDGATHGMWRSPNGIDWTNISPASLGDSMRGMVLAVAPSDERIVYFLGETPGSGLRLPSSYTQSEWYSLWRFTYGSGDGAGAKGTWSNRSMGLPPNDQTKPGFVYNGLASYALVLTISLTDPNTVFLGGTNAWRTTTGFQDTAEIKWLGGYHADFSYSFDPGDLHSDVHTMIISPKTGALYAGSDGGIFRLNNPNVAVPLWVPLSNNYYTTQFYSTALDHSNVSSTTVIGGLQDNGTFATDTVDAKVPWMNFIGGDGCFSAIADDEKEYVVSSQFAMIYGFLKDLSGKSFMDSTANMPYRQLFPDNFRNADYRKYMFVNPFVLDPAQTNIMYIPFGPYVWRNNDILPPQSSSDWTQLMNSYSADNSWITAIGLSKASPPHRAWCGTANGDVFILNNVHQGDPLPTYVTGSNFPVGAYINCVAVDPADGNVAMAVFSNYNVQSLFVTTDGGTAWNAVGGNLEQFPDGTGDGPSCRWATVLHRGNGTQWFVATSIGLFSTTSLNGMNTVWTQEGVSTIGNSIVSMIDARQTDGYVSVATWGNGMFTAKIPTIVAATVPTQIAPRNNAVQVANDTLIAWSPVRGADAYQVLVASDSAFAAVIIDTTGNTLTRRMTNIAANSRYFWKVRTTLATGNSAWSPTWNFTTRSANGVVDISTFIRSCSMEPCMPNPADARTIVRYTLTEQSNVRIELHDMAGRLVRTVMSGAVSSGPHAVNVETSSLIPGMYFLRLRANGMMMTRSFVVAR